MMNCTGCEIYLNFVIWKFFLIMENILGSISNKIIYLSKTWKMAY